MSSQIVPRFSGVMVDSDSPSFVKVTTGSTGVQVDRITGADYERGFFRYSENIFEIGLEQGGTGEFHDVYIRSGANLALTFEGIEAFNFSAGYLVPNLSLNQTLGLSNQRWGASHVRNPIFYSFTTAQKDLSGELSSFEDYSGTIAGTVKANLAEGETNFDNFWTSGTKVITIAETANYDGNYTATRITNTSFYFTHSWDGSESGCFFLQQLAVANSVKIFTRDYAAGDSRLFIQSEAGQPIVLGNNAVEFYKVGQPRVDNYERFRLAWVGNVLQITTEQGGSGSLRGLSIYGFPLHLENSDGQIELVAASWVDINASRLQLDADILVKVGYQIQLHNVGLPDAQNYERAFLKWDTNVLKIGTEKGGNGVVRLMEFIGIPKFTLAVYANNAAALAGGLVAGQFYRSGADPDVVYIVH